MIDVNRIYIQLNLLFPKIESYNFSTITVIR